jgi:hypothetical protein
MQYVSMVLHLLYIMSLCLNLSFYPGTTPPRGFWEGKCLVDHVFGGGGGLPFAVRFLVHYGIQIGANTVVTERAYFSFCSVRGPH